MKKFVFYLLWGYVFISCTHKDQTELFVEAGVFQYDISAGENIEDYDLINDSTLIGVSDKNIIYFWDFFTGKVLRADTIELKRRIVDVCYYKEDSVYLLPVYDYQILLKTKDKLVNLLPLDELKRVSKLVSFNSGVTFFELMSSPGNEICFHKGQLIVPSDIDLFTGSCLNRSPYHILSIDTSAVSAIDAKTFRFPEHYDQTGRTYDFLEYENSFCLTPEGNVLVSFACDDSLYLYRDTSLICKINAKIEGVELPDMLTYQDVENDASVLKYITVSSYYINIIYDPYKNCYYRFAVFPQDYKEEGGLINNTYLFKIAVFNSDFDLIGEQEFLDRNFFPFGAIPAKDGILLKNIPDYGDGRFTLFKANL